MAGSVQPFNIMIVAQAGRLQYEAILFAASLGATNAERMTSGYSGRLVIAEPAPGGLWPSDPRICDPAVRDLLERLGARFVTFDSRHFGADYPYGNKIEALKALPAGEPFVFFDTDTLITGPLDRVGFDFDRPSASMRCEGTWPVTELYGPGYGAIWRALYDRFGLDFESSLDLRQPDEYWRRYLYFNAGWFFYRCPHEFGSRFTEYATEIRRDPPVELIGQALFPWLDQIALPLVIHALGGGRPGPDLAGLDGDTSCHYRLLPLLYARESDHAVAVLHEISAAQSVKKILRGHEPARKMIYQGKGGQVRALFDRDDLPRREQLVRNTIKRAGLWMR